MGVMGNMILGFFSSLLLGMIGWYFSRYVGSVVKEMRDLKSNIISDYFYYKNVIFDSTMNSTEASLALRRHSANIEGLRMKLNIFSRFFCIPSDNDLVQIKKNLLIISNADNMNVINESAEIVFKLLRCKNFERNEASSFDDL